MPVEKRLYLSAFHVFLPMPFGLLKLTTFTINFSVYQFSFSLIQSLLQ